MLTDPLLQKRRILKIKDNWKLIEFTRIKLVMFYFLNGLIEGNNIFDYFHP